MVVMMMMMEKIHKKEISKNGRWPGRARLVAYRQKRRGEWHRAFTSSLRALCVQEATYLAVVVTLAAQVQQLQMGADEGCEGQLGATGLSFSQVADEQEERGQKWIGWAVLAVVAQV